MASLLSGQTAMASLARWTAAIHASSVSSASRGTRSTRVRLVVRGSRRRPARSPTDKGRVPSPALQRNWLAVPAECRLGLCSVRTLDATRGPWFGKRSVHRVGCLRLKADARDRDHDYLEINADNAVAGHEAGAPRQHPSSLPSRCRGSAAARTGGVSSGCHSRRDP
jgi:hypothetical protein